MRMHIIALALCLCASYGQAQEILGTVFNQKTKEPLINASVTLKKDTATVAGVVTDFDGNYFIKISDTGTFSLTVSYTGYETQTIIGIKMDTMKQVRINFRMTDHTPELKEMIITYKKSELVRNSRGATIVMRPTIKANAPVIGRSNAATGKLYIVDGCQVNSNALAGLTPGVIVQKNNWGNKKRRKQSVFSRESYKRITENDFMNVKSTPLSTLSVDVDRASYANVRRYIAFGQRPPEDAVRVEEMINYFNYDYAPTLGDTPVAIYSELVECPWKRSHQLLRIGLQAKQVFADSLPPSNLCFLIDVSGSMNEQNKLPLLKESLRLLVNKLRKEDRVAIVVYAGAAGLVLPSTPGDQKETIMEAIGRLEAGGATAGAEGIELAYKVTQEHYIKSGNNRVILATDGDFNVGMYADNELAQFIAQKRKTGIFLSCLGYGTDNYKDDVMETLADKGNGNYNYIDNIKEAEKTLVKEFGGTIYTVAKDVKAQIEFNPARVQSYRLIGYENRLLNAEDFKDDKKDAAEMGAGHTVTILYEIVPAGAPKAETRAVDELKYQENSANTHLEHELATIKVRYKLPDGNESAAITHAVDAFCNKLNDASSNTRFAASVAMFGLLLRGSSYVGTTTVKDVVSLATQSMGADKDGYRKEFVDMANAYSLIKKTDSN